MATTQVNLKQVSPTPDDLELETTSLAELLLTGGGFLGGLHLWSFSPASRLTAFGHLPPGPNIQDRMPEKISYADEETPLR